jgi:anti-sigma factor RsiW
MECVTITRNLPAYLDGRDSDEERRIVAAHLAACPECAATVSQHAVVRERLRHMPVRTPGDQLRTQLQVIASKEQARRVRRVSFKNAFAAWRDRSRLSLQNLMKPLALPVAGGLASSVILFGMLVPDFAMEVHPVHNDVPTSLFTEVRVKGSSPIAMGEAEIVVDLTVDENGRMVDYNIVHGENLVLDGSARRRLENTLLFTEFTPATTFGQPMSGKIRVSFRSSRIDVKG